MHAVRVEPLCQPDIVVDDERDVALRTDRTQRLAERGRGMLVDVLHPELERGNGASIKCPREALWKVATALERGHQIQLASRPAHVATEILGEIGIERAQRIFEFGHVRPLAAHAALVTPARGGVTSGQNGAYSSFL
jgi:hypothetical protein